MATHFKETMILRQSGSNYVKLIISPKRTDDSTLNLTNSTTAGSSGRQLPTTMLHTTKKHAEVISIFMDKVSLASPLEQRSTSLYHSTESWLVFRDVPTFYYHSSQYFLGSWQPPPPFLPTPKHQAVSRVAVTKAPPSGSRGSPERCAGAGFNTERSGYINIYIHNVM